LLQPVNGKEVAKKLEKEAKNHSKGMTRELRKEGEKGRSE
jgi:hypothetical protein